MNYNRYSYCFNNPFKYTDPSGYTTTPSGDGGGSSSSTGFSNWSEFDDAINDIWNSQYYGGTSSGPGSPVYFSTEDEAEAAGHKNLSNYDVLYKVTFKGHTSYIAGTGDISTHVIGSDGGLNFPNFIGGMTDLSMWGTSNGNGGSSYQNSNNWQITKDSETFNKIGTAAGVISTDIDLVKKSADIIDKLGPVARGLSIAGHAGTFLGAASAAYSGYKVYNEIETGQNVNGLDVADAVVGTAGTIASVAGTVATVLGAATPVGWVVVGGVATVYGVVRLGMFICNGE